MSISSPSKKIPLRQRFSASLVFGALLVLHGTVLRELPLLATVGLALMSLGARAVVRVESKKMTALAVLVVLGAVALAAVWEWQLVVLFVALGLVAYVVVGRNQKAGANSGTPVDGVAETNRSSLS